MNLELSGTEIGHAVRAHCLETMKSRQSRGCKHAATMAQECPPAVARSAEAVWPALMSPDPLPLPCPACHQTLLRWYHHKFSCRRKDALHEQSMFVQASIASRITLLHHCCHDKVDVRALRKPESHLPSLTSMSHKTCSTHPMIMPLMLP